MTDRPDAPDVSATASRAGAAGARDAARVELTVGGGPLERVRARLRERVRGDVRFGRHDRLLYATDASLYQVEPLGVVIPADADDARAALAACLEAGVAVLPRGGGTSLAGQCVNEAVVIDVSAGLGRVLEVDAEGRCCRVEAGVNLADLNRHLAPTGLFFAPDPSTIRQCNVGGAIGNNAAGTRSILYGRTSESLLGVRTTLGTGADVVLDRGAAAREVAGPSGAGPVCRLTDGVEAIVREHAAAIRERFPRTPRRNAGYALDMMLDAVEEADRRGTSPRETINLAHLVCGAEGTLGLVTEAEVRLHPLPRARGLAVLGFADLDTAIRAVGPLLEVEPAAVELLDDMVIGLARGNREHRANVELMPQPRSGALSAVLYVEVFSGAGPDDVRARFERIAAIAREVDPDCGLSTYEDPAAMERALELRRAGEPLLHGLPGARKPIGFVEDNAVPVEHLVDFVRRFRGIVEAHGTTAAFYAHASVGVLHVRPLLDLRDEADRERMEAIATEVADLARELGGVMSGEHGDGRARGPLLERHFGPELVDAFRRTKALFDPHGRLNPGNIVAPAAIDSIHEQVRVRPAGRNLPQPDHDGALATDLDFSAEGGFDHAVELCNGAGVCRKRAQGTMCPSYRATLDERHSTRGRGNALRLAVTGQVGPAASPSGGPPAWNDPDVLETLDLCLSCKACRSECPSNVDVASYKAEYLARSHAARGGAPLAARVMAHVRTLNALGSLAAPLSTWIARSTPARFVANRLLGIHPERSLPAFAPSIWRARRRSDGRRGTATVAPDAPSVVLHADCFTAFGETGIGLAAIRLLEAFGYRVEIPRIDCCGRPAISLGLLPEAARMAASSARTLEAALAGAHGDVATGEPDAGERPVAAVFLEPSCLSAVRDEWGRLRRGGPAPAQAAALSAASFALEDFLDARWDEHPRRPVFTPPAGVVALHGHCHQKALDGVASSARMLARVAGDRLRVLDAGCCGMAGSFGYGRDRHALSLRIAELELLPAVRSLGPDDVLLAPGTSCRHQVHDATAGASGDGGSGSGAAIAVHPVAWLADRLAASAGEHG